MTNHSSRSSQCLIGHRHIELVIRQISTEGATQLNGSDRFARARPAAKISDQRSSGNSKGGLDNATLRNITRQLEHLCSQRALLPQCGIGLCAARQD